MQPLAMTIEDAVQISGCSRSRLYEAMGNGMIKAIKAGRRTLIVGDSLRAYLESLPAATISAPKTTAQ